MQDQQVKPTQTTHVFVKRARNGRSVAQCRAIFLAFLADGYPVAYCAAQAGVERGTVYTWRRDDPEFAQAWEDAYEAGGDVFELHLRERALKTDTTALIVALKMRKRFVERTEVDTTIHTPHSAAAPLAEFTLDELKRLIAVAESGHISSSA